MTQDSVSLTMFNNNNTIPPSTTNQTSGLFWTLNTRDHSATLDRTLTDPAQPLYVGSQGALNVLQNGNTLMGYGQLPSIKEYTPTGAVALSIQFGNLTSTTTVTTQSYRTYRFPWHATPAATSPVAVVDNGRVYMSWNGATDVTQWEIYQGATANKLSMTKTVPKSGFETSTTLQRGAQYVQVVAYNGKTLLKRSNVVKVGGLYW
jgi:hypothetical protein